MGLRLLVAVTCVAVLALVGHYFWRQYRAGTEADERARTASCNEAIRNLEALNQGKWRAGIESRAVYEVQVRACIARMQGD